MGKVVRKNRQQMAVLQRTMTKSNHPTTPFLIPFLWYHGPPIAPSRNHFYGYYIIMYFPLLQIILCIHKHTI